MSDEERTELASIFAPYGRHIRLQATARIWAAAMQDWAQQFDTADPGAPWR